MDYIRTMRGDTIVLEKDGLFVEVSGEDAIPAALASLSQAVESQSSGRPIAGLGLFIGKRK